MGCVNIKNPEFKNLAKKHNVSSGTLELITHKYWIESGNEDSFPSDIYIQAQLGNTQYQEPGKAVRELWNSQYSTPQEFTSFDELQTAKAKAAQFFPQSAIVNYQDNKGNYILRIKEPVEKVSKDKSIFFRAIEGDSNFRNILRNILKNTGLDYNTLSEEELKKEILNAIKGDMVTSEMTDIKAKAEADGTFMKAPNGNPTNLNERQWLQVRTKAFKDWFGDWENNPQSASKVIDENGEPLVVYRGTRSDSTVHTTGTFRSEVIFTTPNKRGASRYGEPIALFINAKNPAIIDYKGEKYDKKIEDEFYEKGDSFTALDRKAKNAVNQGYDALVIKNVKDGTNYSIDDYAITNPNQIKSATDNIGTFSTLDNNIQFAINKKKTNKSNESQLELFSTDSFLTPQLIDHLKSIGLNVLGEAEMEEFLKKNNISTLQQMAEPYSKDNPYYNRVKAPRSVRNALLSIIKSNKYNNDGTDAVIIDSDPLHLYLVDHSTHALLEENEKENITKGARTDLFGIRAKLNINKLTENDIRFIARNIASDYRNSETLIQHRLQKLGITTENLPGIDITSAIKRGIRDNGKVDDKAGTTEEQTNQNRSSANSSENKGVLQFIKTPQGEVYGFVDKEGNIYLDESAISSEHPIHEYTHLWDRAVAKNNPELWKRGVELMKQTSLWNEVLEDSNYGKQWQSMNITGDKLESLIASEVHSRLTGKEGEKLLLNEEKKGSKKLINHLKQWLNDFFTALKETFSKWTDKDLDNLTQEEFINMTLRDLAKGINPNNIKALEEAINNIPGETLRKEINTIKQEEKDYDLVNPNTNETINPNNPQVVFMANAEIEEPKHFDKDSYDEAQQYQQSYLKKSPTEVETILSEYDKLTTQINNLLDSEAITATEVRHIAELVVNSISDEISRLQKEEGLAKTLFPSVNTELDFQNASRKQIVEAVGIDNLIDRANKIFVKQMDNNEDIETMIQAQLIQENWGAIVTLASDVFAMNEGFGITKDYSKGNFTTTESSQIDYDNFNGYENDLDRIAEEEGKDEQEHWQIETRTIDVLNSMSALVRQGLHECYLLDENNNQILSKWGIPERVNARKAVNNILKWTQGTLSLPEMITRLSERQQKNPWVSKLVERLSDTTGKETDFQSQFFGVFSKHFQPYSIVLLKDGKYASIPVNDHPARSEAVKTITAQFKVGQHPLFNVDKVNSKLLGSDRTTGKDSDFNLHKALSELQDTVKELKVSVDSSLYKKASTNILGVCRILGYNISEDSLQDIINTENVERMTNALSFIVKDLDKAYQAQHRGELKNYTPFDFDSEYSISNALRNFLTPITDSLEDTAITAFYDSGKMYQSYVTPSFLTKLMNKFRLEGQEFEDFIMEEYGSSEWFKAPGGNINTGWKNEWLRLLANKDEGTHKIFDHKVELNFNKHNYMRNMSDAEYTLSLITEYFSEIAQKGQSLVPAWFRIPMQSNKPSSEFIKFYSYRGANYKDSIIMGLHSMYLQELSRIQTVRMRNHSKNDSEFIKNFDTNGRKFNFLPLLNSYLENTEAAKAKRNILRNADSTVSKENNELANLLQKKVEATTQMTPQEEARLSTLVDKVIRQNMENRVQSILNTWEANSILEAAKNVKGVNKDNIRESVENFLWNDAFASKNILQLTITDIAFYKDTEDLQKRLAQLHAPGTRGRIDAIDYEGNRVSDGKYRTFVLQDFDSFKSNIIANISEVFDRKIQNAPEDQRPQLKALKESLVGKDGKYTKINVTDAQGYSSPSSYRKKAFIFGKWSRHAEDIYQKLLKGEYNYTDLETAFQPLKPFVYSKLSKNMGVADAPIKSMQVPFQAKNAEYLLIMADAILRGEEFSRPNLLRAVYRVMEDSEKINPTKGIDTVQFESAIKSGLQGKLNIFQFINTEGGEAAAYTYLMNQLYNEETDSEGKRVYRSYNTSTFVHEASFEDYCLQQEVPEHFKDHSQAHGSQIRMIIPSDLDLYTTDSEDNQVENYYEWTEPDGTKKKVTAEEYKREYENTIAKNIKESINNLAAELHFDSADIKERNIALSKILQREILSSPRYGIDLMQACSIDKNTGEFRIPKGDPIQAKRIEQLINSIIKNRVNKQKIAGGPIVQVSNFGTSKQLHIRFNDKQGNLIPLEEEYNPAEHENLSYKEFVKRNQGGIAYFEVFVPIWNNDYANDIFEKFSNPDGTINVEAMEATDPELLKMISYRIPTEDKYSCAPMKVVGFMPKEAGDAIMLPYELTEIDDSDFDVDKRYVMRKDIPIKRKSRKEVEQLLIKKASEQYKRDHEGKVNNSKIAEQIRMFMDNPEKMKSSMPSVYKIYQSVAYYTDAPISGRQYRDNKIIDMTYAVLTNEMTADKILNPGGFDAPKRAGYMVAAFKNPANNLSWEELQTKTTDELKDLSYTDKDLTFADTQVQFYKQNSAAASLIGVFAVNKVAHATLEGNDIFLDVKEICGENPFAIANTKFSGRIQIDKKYDQNGTLIGKTLGSLVSASADAVKDPILNLMNVNMTTAGMLNTMLRLGMSFEDAALFLSQNIIEKTLDQFNRENLTNYQPLGKIIEARLNAYEEKYHFNENSNINNEDLSTQELIEGLTSNEHDAIDYKVLLTFQKLRKLVDAMRKPTFATRFNSISSAVGPLIIDNLIIEHKMEQFLDSNLENGTHFYTQDGVNIDIEDVFFDHPILKQFARTVDIAKSMFMDMPAGSVGFRNILKKLPSDIADKIYNDKKLLDSLSNFYQSYLLIQSGVVNPFQLKQYIEGFPKWFMSEEQNFKEKYKDNALIQAIKMNVSKKTNHPYLMINITGMDEQQKEELRNAWIDLHKTDPKLSQMLFNYNFFRAGIGFSPKTFMSLVPTYVKERLKSSDEKTSYIDTYRHFPTVVSELVIDQFIRNSWDNNKLVPKKGGKGTHYQVDLKKGELRIYRPKEIADVENLSYIKTSVNSQTILWKRYSSSKEEVVFKEIKPLGNNGEYIEMSTSLIQNPLTNTTTLLENVETSDIKTDSPAETDATEESSSKIISESESIKKTSEIVDLLMKQSPSLNTETARDKFEQIKNRPEIFAGYLQNVFKQKGLELNKEDAVKEFKKYC